MGKANSPEDFKKIEELYNNEQTIADKSEWI
jgi:hypothetical protein